MINPESYHSKEADDKIIPYEKLYDIVGKTLEFYKDPRSVEYLQEQCLEIIKLFSDKPYFEMGAGLGYPFYFKHHEGQIPEEFERFDSEILDKITQEEIVHKKGWRCPKCQTINGLTDLKSSCKECHLVKFKPRDIFKLLPDLDILLVVVESSDSTEKDIENTLIGNGFRQSDKDIAGAIKQSSEVLDNYNHPEGSTNFPIDIHVCSRAELEQAMVAISNGEYSRALPCRSLWGEWTDSKIPFFFDFVFSFWRLGVTTPEIKEMITTCRRGIKAKLKFNKLLSELKQSSPRASRLLESAIVVSQLRDRYEKW